MKIRLSVIIIILISFFSIRTFPQWTWQNPLPHGNNVNVIRFINLNTGWYFSSLGKNLKTTNGGINWLAENLPVNKDINSVKYYKFDSVFYTIWAGGDSGVLIKSTNSGLSWNIVYFPTGNQITDIFFKNANTGFVASNNLYKTTNSGVNWSVVVSWLDTYPRAVFFLNDTVGWVAENSSFYSYINSPYSFYSIKKTINGGDNWNQVYFNSNILGTYSNNLNIYFKDQNNGFARFDFLYNSSNSGSGWSYISYNNIFSFINQNTGFATGYNKFLMTTDFGNSWIVKDSFTVGKIFQNCIESIDLNNTFVGGYYGDIIKTSNGGTNWIFSSKSITRGNITAIYAGDSLNLFALAPDKTLLYTTNGGNNWILFDSLYWSGYKLKSIYFLDKNTGWIGCSGGRLYRTTNGSSAWQSFDLPATGYIKSMKFFNDGFGFLLDSVNRLYSSLNFGSNWTFTSQLSGNVKDFSFPDKYTGFAFASGSVFKTTNSGINWFTVNQSQSNQFILNLKFYDFQTGCRIERESIPVPPYSYYNLKITTDGGLNWNNAGYPSISYSEFYDINFVNENIFYVCSAKGIINLTTNKGVNWSVSQIANADINSITTFNKNIWVAGDYGTILKGSQLVPIGINLISEKIPDNFSLSQNYPNPFNPYTIIKFQIKDSKFVTLKIFDILGKEVAVLVNEKLSPGEYETRFPNNSMTKYQLPSGVYFYKLTAGDFTETKKMILLK